MTLLEEWEAVEVVEEAEDGFCKFWSRGNSCDMFAESMPPWAIAAMAAAKMVAVLLALVLWLWLGASWAWLKAICWARKGLACCCCFWSSEKGEIWLEEAWDELDEEGVLVKLVCCCCCCWNMLDCKAAK